MQWEIARDAPLFPGSAPNGGLFLPAPLQTADFFSRLRSKRRMQWEARSPLNQGSGAEVNNPFSTATVSADSARDCPQCAAAGKIGKITIKFFYL